MGGLAARSEIQSWRFPSEKVRIPAAAVAGRTTRSSRSGSSIARSAARRFPRTACAPIAATTWAAPSSRPPKSSRPDGRAQLRRDSLKPTDCVRGLHCDGNHPSQGLRGHGREQDCFSLSRPGRSNGRHGPASGRIAARGAASSTIAPATSWATTWRSSASKARPKSSTRP